MEPVPVAGDPLTSLQPEAVRRGILPRGPDQLLPQLCQQSEAEQDLHENHVAEAAHDGVRGQLAVPGRPPQVFRTHPEVGEPRNH